MRGYPFDTFGPKHFLYMAGVAGVLTFFLVVGKRYLNEGQRRQVAVAMAVFGLTQELVDDLVRIVHDVWTVHDSLPLHLCSLGMLMSVWALVSRRQLIFEVAYYWGFAASSQAILTPDNTRWTMGEFDILWNFLSHGAILVNVSWLIVVEGMRCRPWSWLRVFLITNLVTVPIALFNLATGANYFFICRKPGGNSPFLIGEWPWYILSFEVLAVSFFLIVYLPMRLARGGAGGRAEVTP